MTETVIHHLITDQGCFDLTTREIQVLEELDWIEYNEFLGDFNVTPGWMQEITGEPEPVIHLMYEAQDRFPDVVAAVDLPMEREGVNRRERTNETTQQNPTLPEDQAYLIRLSHTWVDGPLVMASYLTDQATWEGCFHDGSPVAEYIEEYFSKGDEAYEDYKRYVPGIYLLDHTGLHMMREFTAEEAEEFNEL